jgi:hypothetical protein
MNRSSFVSDLVGGAGRTPLAASRGLIVYHDFEYATVTDGIVHLTFGSLYGDPQCAAIADDQSWCAAGGAGIALLRAPPGELVTVAATPSAVEFPTGGSRTFWVSALWAQGARQLGLVGYWGTSESTSQMWSLDIDTLVLTPLPSPSGS